jgi:pimeloyl-ACP methyl ester carboxylesterase/tRNA A-37 threonylcarbamoyl transferase component Bud32
MIGETRYARSGEVSIAYQVLGKGPVDLVFVPGIVSHVEYMQELPGYSRFLAELAESCRLVTFDKRGNGLSDPVHEPPSLEERMEDIRAVLDAIRSKRAVLFGVSEGAPLACSFTAAYPRRAVGLVLFGGFARMLNGQGFEAGVDPQAYAQMVEFSVRKWGTGTPLRTLFGLSAGGRELRDRAARCERLSATPSMLRRQWEMIASIDVRETLTRIGAPTMVLHRKRDPVVPLRAGRFLAKSIPGARLVELEGRAHFPFVGQVAPTVDEVSRLLHRVAGDGVSARRSRESNGPARPPRSVPLALQRAMERGLGRLRDDDVHGPIEVGRFLVERMLGRGGMGSIYLARDRDLNRLVAIKLLRTMQVDALRRFRQEALAVARISHPNVVQIYELGLDAAAPYLVLEYVPGGSAADLLDGRVPWQRATRIALAVARGLGAAHALGIVHRDIKPANVLLADSGSAIGKVTDFGIAKLASAVEPMTAHGVVLGTHGYMSPEQARGEVTDARTDVFSLGVTWRRLLTAPKNIGPGDARDARGMLPPSVPSSISALVGRFCALVPDERPRNGRAAAEEIEAALAAPRRG